MATQYFSKIKYGNTTYNLTTYTFDTTSAPTNKIRYKINDGNWTDVPITISITDNITGTGTVDSIAKFNGTNSITAGPSFSVSNTTQFLRGDGTWAAPTFTIPTASDTVLGGIKVGTGLAIDENGVLSLDIPVFDGSFT